MHHDYSMRAAVLFAVYSLCPSFVFAGAPPYPIKQANVDSFSHSTSLRQVHDLFFVDNLHGWMAITDHNHNTGYILQTRDGGSSWRRLECPLGIRRLFFLNDEQGWGLRWFSDSRLNQTRLELLGTRDGGEHWKQLSSEPVVESTEQTHESLTSLAFMDQSDGWLVGEGPGRAGLMFTTSNGGRSFGRPKLPTDFSNCLGVYASAKTGVLVFGVGFVARSVDRGMKWESPIDIEKLGINKSAFVISSARFIRDGRGWLVGQAGGGAILVTHDSGQSWRLEFEDKDGTIFGDLWALDTKRRCAVGNSTLLFCTVDDGLTWTSKDVLPPASRGQSRLFGNIVLLDSGRGWIVRYGGFLYRTTDGGQTWSEADPINQ